jgi:hypothetical protein
MENIKNFLTILTEILINLKFKLENLKFKI